MFSDTERSFLTRRRVGHLATADRAGKPHLVPVCFVISDQSLYTAIDEKPKTGSTLRRVQNILDNPNAAFLVDHYEEDWSRLGWVRIDGAAELLCEGAEHEEAIRLLRSRYTQYTEMQLSAIIALRIGQVRSWGNLDR